MVKNFFIDVFTGLGIGFVMTEYTNIKGLQRRTVEVFLKVLEYIVHTGMIKQLREYTVLLGHACIIRSVNEIYKKENKILALLKVKILLPG